MRDANPEDPDGKYIEEDHLPVSTYRIIEPPPEIHEYQSITARPMIDSEVKAEVKAQKPARKPPTSRPSWHEALIERVQRFAENPTRFYAAIGVGLGVLLGVIIAAVFMYTSSPEGRYDLGPVTSNATGLTGHLYLKWEKKLHYRLTFETSDSHYQAGFATAVANPPHPLSIEIYLQDADGFVLRSRKIVLRYDARSAALAAHLPNETQPVIDPAQLEVQEQKREQGNDIFQNQIAPNGKIAAINAQGEIPCSKNNYEKTDQWSFSSDFPSLAEQDEWLERQPEMRANTAQRPTVHKKATKTAGKPLLFSIEGDDVIVEFDAISGVIETRGRNTFVINKTIAQSADPVWQDYPVSIHFRCNQGTECTLMHAGAGALYAKLRR